MWISQTAYLKTFEERQKQAAELDASNRLVAAQKSTLEWLMLRMTQLEAERAKLLWTYMGIKVPVPEIVHADPEPGSSVDNPMNALPSFTDMGDDKARRDGYAWDSEGHLTLHGHRIN